MTALEIATAASATTTMSRMGLERLPDEPAAGRGNRRESVAARGGEPADRDDRRLGELCAVGGLGQTRRRRDRGPGHALDAIAVRHHDQQRLRPAEADLLLEERGVALRMGEQLRDRAEVGGRGEQRHLDREVQARRGRRLGVERALERRRHRGLIGIEDALDEEHVARRIGVRARPRRHQQGERQHQAEHGRGQPHRRAD